MEIDIYCLMLMQMPRLVNNDLIEAERRKAAWEAEAARIAAAWEDEKARRPKPTEAEMTLRAKIWEDEKDERNARCLDRQTRMFEITDKSARGAMWAVEWKAEKALRANAWNAEKARRLDVWTQMVGAAEVARWKESWNAEKAKRAEFAKAEKAKRAEFETGPPKVHDRMPKRFAHIMAKVDHADVDVILGYLASLSAVKGYVDKIAASAALGMTPEAAGAVLNDLHERNLLKSVKHWMHWMKGDWYKVLRTTVESAKKAKAVRERFDSLVCDADARIANAEAEQEEAAAAAMRRAARRKAALPPLVKAR